MAFFIVSTVALLTPMATEAPNQVAAEEALQSLSVSESQSQGEPSSSSSQTDQ